MATKSEAVDPTPQPKVVSAGISGAAATVLIFLAGLAGIEITPEVAGAFVTLAAFAGGYFKSN